MRQTDRPNIPRILENHLLIGALVIATTIAAVLFAYSAQTGLPFVPTYRATVQLQDATRLLVAAPVRVGGAQVGIVKAVSAVPASATEPAHAAVEIAINPNLGPLPVDTTVDARPISVLGGKYLALSIGRSRVRLRSGEPLPLSQSIATVDIDYALRIFAPAVRRALRGTIQGYGDGLAGRGFALNDAIASLSDLIGPAARVSTVLARPQTGLSGLISGADAFGSALEPVGLALADLATHGGPALAAFRGRHNGLAADISTFPGVEQTVDAGVAHIDPVLADATLLDQRIRAGTRLLGSTSGDLAAALQQGVAPLRATPPAADRLKSAMAALDQLAVDPASTNALRLLTDAVSTLQPTLAFLTPAQTVCNALGIFARNLASAYSEGDANGAWERQTFIYETHQDFQEASPDPALHDNYYPIENGSQCEAGNEPYLPGQRIGNVHTGTKVDHTSPPPASSAHAAAAGLLTPLPGAAR